jgi:predicted transcriptional regulator
METPQNTTQDNGSSQNVTNVASAIPNDIYSSLKSECDSLGISISKLCREADVDRSVLERWRRSDPKSIKTYNALLEALEKLKQSNQ